MQRALIYPVLCLSLGLTAGACGRDRDASSDNRMTGAVASDAPRKEVEVTGCLTANKDTNQFVLTANSTALTSMTNRAAAGEAETFHYQLVGGTDLQSHVGREVVVTGTVAGDGKDVNMTAKERAVEDRSTPRRSDEATPAVETKQEVEMQVEQLQVASIRPTGTPCQIGTGSGQ